jgi:hypothetical protein
LYWTHNDSGDDARLFAFDRQGRHHGTCKIERADNADWEALDSCLLDGRPYLLIGDIGDNTARRQRLTIHVVPEPIDPADDGQAVAQVDFEIPGGPVDCEAMALDVERNELLVVEKQIRSLTSRVFAVPWPERLSIGVKKEDRPLLKATVIASVPHLAVTAMDVSTDNRFLVLNTYGDLYVYSRGASESWSQALARPPVRIRGPARRQGEAVCFDRSSLDILLTSEGSGPPLWLVEHLSEN